MFPKTDYPRFTFSRISIGLATIFALAFSLDAAPLSVTISDAAMKRDWKTVRSLLGQTIDVDLAQGDGSTALHWAAYWDELDAASALIEAGADVNAITRLGGLTPVFMAAKNGSALMLDLLFEAGSDVDSTNSNGSTLLMLTAAAGNVDAVKTLLERGAEVNKKDTTNGQTALMFASARGRTEVVRILIEHGSELDLTTNVTEIIKREYRYREKDSREFRREGSRSLPTMGGNTALQFAAREGHLDVAKELVSAGADVNRVNAADNLSAVAAAIINGKFDVAMYLVKQGADPNLANNTGLTPLYAVVDAQWAARTWYPPPTVTEEQTHYLDLMKALVRSGANVNARLSKKLWFRTFHGDWIKQEGATAFWRAAKSNDVAAMRLLVSAGANPSIPTVHGATPLLAAAGFGLEPQTSNVVPNARLLAVQYLVEEVGADVNLSDNQGYTPLHGAALTENREVMLYLIAMGANVKARANMIFGGIGETDRNVDGATGDSVADMANGPKPHNLQYPETTAFLVNLGSENSDHCRAATCVVKDFPEESTPKD